MPIFGVSIAGGLAPLQEAAKHLSDSADRGVRKAVRITALNIQRLAKENISSQGAVDTGDLRRKIQVDYSNGGFSASITAYSDHASYIELGTHHSRMPPPEVLRDWCRRHGMPESAAFVVARAILRRGGLKPRPFLKPAWDAEAPLLAERMADEVRKELKE